MKTGLVLGIGRQSETVTSLKAVKIGQLPNVELVANKASHGYDESSVEAAASRSDFIFVNTDGFELGEQADTYWGIRLFELASKSNVKHLIYSGLDYIGKKSHFDPTLYVGHYEGKARVQEFIHAQEKSPIAWTIIRTGPYIENLSQLMAPIVDPDGTFVFSLPLANGAVPYIHLDDIGGYVQWALSHPEQSNGLDLGVATAHRIQDPKLQRLNYSIILSCQSSPYPSRITTDCLTRVPPILPLPKFSRCFKVFGKFLEIFGL